MIHDHDRSGWFGASDTKYVLADNHQTKTWQNFWLEKCGAITKDTGNPYTAVGSAFEHPILDAIDADINKDRQIILEDKRLRVNYDGDKDGTIFEVKTHKGDNEFLTKNAEFQYLPKYIYGQVQVQMYVWKEARERGLEIAEHKKLYVVEYPLYAEDFSGEPEVDINRLKFHRIKYDKGFIKSYLKKLEPLTQMLVEAIDGKEIEKHIHG